MRAAHGEHDVSVRHSLGQADGDAGASGHVFRIENAGLEPGSGLNRDLCAKGDKFADGLGRSRNTGFAL